MFGERTGYAYDERNQVLRVNFYQSITDRNFPALPESLIHKGLEACVDIRINRAAL
jgi:hypothetical protein